MRHYHGYIALSLLAAALVGCSSADTGSTSTSNGGQDPLTGALAKYQGKIQALATPPAYTASSHRVDVVMTTSEMAVLSTRAVDKVLLVNGFAVLDASNVPVPAANVTRVVVADSAGDGSTLDGTSEVVLVDIRNGVIAARGAGNAALTTGIDVYLNSGTAHSDEVGVLGSTGKDSLGCVHANSIDSIGIKTATSKDIAIKSAVAQITVDLNDGDDSYDQASCTTTTAVYGGAGNDTIIAGSVDSSSDTYSGGAGTDILSYANRTTPVIINLGAADIAVPFAMVSLTAGEHGHGEADVLTDDFETINGSAYADTIASGANVNGYTLNGNAGDDTFTTDANTHLITINGGVGTDTVDYSARGVGHPVTVTMGDSIANDGETTDKNNVTNTVENLIGTDDADHITGNASANVIRPGKGSDVVIGGDGDDTMVAGAAAGTDIAAGAGDGDDQFIGGKGNDTVDYSVYKSTAPLGVTVTMDGVVAADGKSITSATASGLVVESDKIGVDVENIIGTIGVDTLNGTSVSNSIWGLGGADTIVGGAGDDLLDGNPYTDGAAHDCNPVTLKCVDPTAVGCACATALTTGTCTALITCGDGGTDHGDPLDFASCSGGTNHINYNINPDVCWKTQG